MWCDSNWHKKQERRAMLSGSFTNRLQDNEKTTHHTQKNYPLKQFIFVSNWFSMTWRINFIDFYMPKVLLFKAFNKINNILHTSSPQQFFLFLFTQKISTVFGFQKLILSIFLDNYCVPKTAFIIFWKPLWTAVITMWKV